MRSFIALVLAAVLAVACGREDQTPSPGEAPPASSTPPQAARAPAPELPSDDAIAQMLAPWKGDLDGMVERRYVRMLVTFSRTNYFLDKAEQRGITYEAGRLFEAFLNQRLRSKAIQVHVAFIPVSRDRILQALAEGRGDIAAANLTITPERETIVDFATPWLSDVREVVVTTADQPPLSSATDLSGREVRVRRSSSYFASLVALNETLRAAGREPVVIVEVSEVLEDEDILEMVNADLIPATVVDTHIAELWDGIFDQIRVHGDVAIRSGGENAWALRPDTPQLREAVNEFVAANAKGSLNFNLLFRRYFKDARWIRNAAAEAELQRFRQAVDFFRRYGDQYDLPWLLVAAQAYQESQIDHRRPLLRRRAHGSAEQGTLRGRVLQRGSRPGRRAATKGGEDGPRSEPVVRQRRGRRRARDRSGTVPYVSNIYKYYVSYTLISRQVEARRQAR